MAPHSIHLWTDLSFWVAHRWEQPSQMKGLRRVLRGIFSLSNDGTFLWRHCCSTKHPRNQYLLPASSHGAVVEMVRNLKRGTNMARNSSFMSYLPSSQLVKSGGSFVAPGALAWCSPVEHRRRSRHQPAHGRQPSRGHHEEESLPALIRTAIAAA
jgi:hypothetical protein